MAKLPLTNEDGSARRSDGKQVYAVVVNYRDHTGRRRQARRNAVGITEANTVERDLHAKRDALELPDQQPPAAPPPEALTVSAYLDRWLTGRQTKIGHSTVKRYREALIPVRREVGSVHLDALTTLQIKGVYDSITAAGRTEKTALNTHRVLKQALQDAIDIYDLIGRNPAIKQIAPKADQARPTVVSRDDLDRILAAADEADSNRKPGEPKIAPLVRLITLTGLRLGEALALTWTDLDLDNARLSVNRTLNTYGAIGEPKTDRSRRTIGISPETVSLLRDVRRKQAEDKLAAGKAYTDNGYVFANVIGGPWTQWNVNHHWKRIVKQAGEPKEGEEIDKARADRLLSIRVHDLRHTHASHLLAAGWELSAVAERLGHSRTSTTLDFYSHALPNRNAELVNSVDGIFGVAK